MNLCLKYSGISFTEEKITADIMRWLLCMFGAINCHMDLDDPRENVELTSTTLKQEHTSNVCEHGGV